MLGLPPDLDNLVRQHLDVGGYDSEEEVLRAAMEALAERESAIIEADKESIQRGLADLAAGRVRPVEVAEAEFQQRVGLDRTE